MSKSQCGYNSNNVHEFDTVKTNGKLTIGVLNAFKGAFDLGVKYTKEIIITVTTAEMMVMVDVGMGAFEKIIQKVKNIKELEPIGEWMVKFIDYKLKFVDSELEIVKYMGYVYLMRSFKEYSDALKSSNLPNPEINNEQFTDFLKMLSSGDLVKQGVDIKHAAQDIMNNNSKNPKNPKNIENPKPKQPIRGGNDSNNDALKIANRIIDQILLLPLHLQIDELVKIIDKIKKIASTKKMTGGMSRKRTNKYKSGKKSSRRHITKKTKRMIHGSLKLFS